VGALWCRYFGQSCEVRVQSLCYLPVLTVERDNVSLRGDDLSVKQIDEISRDAAEQVCKGDNLLMSISSVFNLQAVNDVSNHLIDVVGLIFELCGHVLQ